MLKYMKTTIKENLIASYQENGGFIVHSRQMLERLYGSLGIDPKTSLDWRIFELEGISHFFQHGIARLARELAITKDDYVLSPGEGSGAPSRFIAKLIGCRVVGVDLNPDQITKAKDLAFLHGIENNVDYYEQDIEELSLGKNDFTVAYCNETCTHWENKAKAFERLFAHLKVGARVGFNAWLSGDKGSLNDAYVRVPDFKPLYQPGIWFQNDLYTYQRLLQDAGFRIRDMRDCTDIIDIRMRARVKASVHWQRYELVMGRHARESAVRYYEGMLKTHYDYLRYGVIIAEKPVSKSAG